MEISCKPPGPEIEEPKEIRIEDCVVVGGAKFRASTNVAWEKPMYLVETEDGTYISSTIMEHQHAKGLPCGSPIKWMDGYVGRKLKVRTSPGIWGEYKDKKYLWIVNCDSSGDEDFPF